MILLIRFVLISLIIYLLVRSFTRFIEGEKESGQKGRPDNYRPERDKKISKEVGEFVDYEEVD